MNEETVSMTKKAIWKYALNDHMKVLPLPAGAEILSVVNQREEIMLYALVEPEQPLEEVTFYVIGTGWELLDSFFTKDNFIGTVLTNNASLVWHVFQQPNEEGGNES